MATPILAGTTPAVPARSAQLNALEDALNTAHMRVRAVLAILDKGELYDAAAAQGEGAYALITAAECLLKDAADTAHKALNRVWITPSSTSQAAEVAHG